MRLCFPAGTMNFHFVCQQHLYLFKFFKQKIFLGDQTLLVSMFSQNAIKSSNAELCSDGISCAGLCVFKCQLGMRNRGGKKVPDWVNFCLKKPTVTPKGGRGKSGSLFFHVVYSETNHKIFFRVMYLYQRCS